MTITIRQAALDDAAGIAVVAVDTWRTAYRGIVPDAVLDSLSYERRAAAATQQIQAIGPRQTTLVAAADDGRVVGFASGGPERTGSGYDGELYAIYVLAEFHGRGIGRRLVRALAGELAAGGFRSLLLWVLADNQPGRRFYEAMGGVAVAEQTIEIGATLLEVAYGWPDIALLAAEPPAC